MCDACSTDAAAAAERAATSYSVPDMSCGHCVGAIRDAFGKAMPGTSVDIDLGSCTVRIAGDPALVRKVLADAGYPATPVA